MANIGNRLFRWVLWPLVGVLGLLILCFAALQNNYVKQQLTNVILNVVTERTGYRTTMSDVKINWFDQVSISGFQIIDDKDSIMISSDVSKINYSLSTLLSSSKLQVDEITVAGGQLHLFRHSDSSSINLIDFISRLSNRDKTKKGRSITINEVECKDLQVSYRDLRVEPPGDSIFRPNYFLFDIQSLGASKLQLANDTLSVKFREMAGQELYSGLPVRNFKSDFYLFPTAIVLDQALIETDRSIIRDSISLSFRNPGNLAFFRDSVKMDLRLSETEFDIRDLRFFGNVPEISQKLNLNGIVSGYLSNLHLEDFLVSMESGDNIAFDASLFGLPNINETFIDLDVKNASIQEQLLNQLSSGKNEWLDKLGFRGALVGFLSDFVVFGTVSTEFGEIETDINLKLADSIVESQYSGKFAFSKFQVGDLLRVNQLEEMDFEGSIQGSGFNAGSADFLMNATVQNLMYDDYSYDSLGINGQFKANFFDGKIGVRDDRGKVDGIATIDFSVPEEIISVKLNIDSVDLNAFSLASRKVWYSSELMAELNEIDIDKMTGEITLRQVDIRSNETVMGLDTIQLKADQFKTNTYGLRSDIVDASVKGDFKITELITDLPAIVKAFTSEFVLEADDSLRLSPEISYQAEFEFEIKSLNPLFELLALPIAISDGSEIDFQFKHLSDISFNLYAKIDTVRYKDRFFYSNKLQVDASKSLLSNDVLALFQFSSSKQSWNEKISTQRLSLEAVWDQNEINSSIQISQPENQNRANVKSITTLKTDTIDFQLLPSNIVVFNTPWTVNRNNRLQLLRDKLLIEQLELYKGNQYVSIEGVVSDSSLTLINFNFKEFDLLNLSTLSPRVFGGILDASGSLSRLNANQPLRIETDIAVDHLSFEEIPIGNLKGSTSWDRSVDGLYVDYSITRENIETIDLSGYFKPFQEEQLDLQVSFDKAKLDLLEPLFETLISDLDGTATGELNLSGRASAPKLRGISTINGGIVTIDYLNTVYGFSGVTRFFEEQIAFDNIIVADRFGHRGALNGAINHEQFQNVELNVSMSFNEFELLNTNRQQNSLYYGNAYATGKLDLRGPVENILISAEATSTSNTRVYIPLIEENTAQQGAFIKFKSKVDSLEVEEEEINLSGINIDFDMDITPEAYIELIFNPRTGDIIRGRGEGNLQLTVNSSGDFDLFGGYTVSEGAYNFTTSLINKEFQLVPGGVINWFGDPYQGQMDMTATYRQLADIQDWNPNDSISPRSIVNVNLGMQGPMLSPEIGFKLELDDQNSADPRWNQVIATINSEEEELKRQVFSLLILRKFSQREEFIVGGGNTLTTGINSSVSEFISNQLSYWLNQVDQNLEIDFDINSLSADAFNTFQLRLAYSFLDGRLRVTRGGGVTTIVEDNTGTDLQGILGDWSVEYVLTEDGKWRARFFSRNNQSNSTSQQQQETGLSLQYVTSFDEFKEIISSTRKPEQSDL